MQSVACGVMPAALAHFIDGMILRVSLSPQKIRGMSTPWACFTLYINSRTSSGTGYMRRALRPRSSMWVLMPTSLNSLQNARTAALGFSPAMRFTCSKAPPFVSTRLKQPMSIITGAMRSNWSLRGWNLPLDCHMSR